MFQPLWFCSASSWFLFENVLSRSQTFILQVYNDCYTHVLCFCAFQHQNQNSKNCYHLRHRLTSTTGAEGDRTREPHVRSPPMGSFTHTTTTTLTWRCFEHPSFLLQLKHAEVFGTYTSCPHSSWYWITLSAIIMLQSKITLNQRKGNHRIRHTHFTLNHDLWEEGYIHTYIYITL